ncbi:hypothetical protein M413DRAFT_29838 [Hebeloma cylindrosporum]|uniref:C2H2-type domain-containing protein n=1 Tax=Hebeloma cylindrosporum TaxID=76867 RepID=A0A0C3C5N4_HEBCY|nr:hypothetical protein M413DRAFT_29838 [Hebeloma cylindrosporum h7]
MAGPHSASNRYEPYPQRKHSTRGFVGRRDIGNYSLYHDVYHDAQHSEHGYRGSHFDPGQSALLYETRRVYAIDPPIPHCITDNGYPFGRFPVRQHHHSLNHPAGRYLNVHQLPSQRGSVETDVRYPTCHGDYQYPQPHTSCDTRPPQPQASSECAPSDSRLTRSEDKGNNPIDDNVRSPQAVKVNSRRSKRSKSPISDDRWTTFCVNIGKQKGYQGDCYRCEYPVWKDGKLEPCNFGSFGSEKNTVKRHANAVHLNIREHECEYCPKAFSQKQALRVHMNTVHRDKGRVRPFPCKHCNQDFGDPSKRNKHYRKAHPEVEIKPRKNLPRRAIDIDAEPPLPVPASNAE